jgi:phage gpG-like protein
MIIIKINDREVVAALGKLAGRCSDMRPAMDDIGEYMIESIKKRFATGTAPDGSKWAPNKTSTIREYFRKKGGGTVLRKGERMKVTGGELLGSSKKVMIGESKRLGTEVASRPESHRVEISSSPIYSATQHFGAKRGSFGRTKRGAPIPWGDIPARPYMDLSEEDKAAVLDIIQEHLELTN